MSQGLRDLKHHRIFKTNLLIEVYLAFNLYQVHQELTGGVDIWWTLITGERSMPPP